MNRFSVNTCSSVHLHAILWLVIIISFSPGLSADYVFFDEHVDILANPLIRAPFSVGALKNIFSSYVSNQYTPLTIASFWVEYNIFGFNTTVSHLINLFLHLLAASVVFHLTSIIGCSKKLAFLVAICWAIHPIQAETVVWVLERRNLLFGLFFFASLAAYDRFAVSGESRWMMVASIFMLISGLAKSLAFLLPLNWLLLDRLASRKMDARSLLSKLPGILVAVVLVSFLFSGVKNRQFSDVSDLMFKRATYNLAFYVAKTVLPINLSPIYEDDGSEMEIFEFGPLWFFVLLSVFIWLGLKNRLLAFSIMFYLLNIMPLSGLIQVGYRFWAALHFLYVPLYGLVLLAALSFKTLIKKYPKAWLWWAMNAAAVLIVIALLAISYQHSLIWRDSQTLFDYCLKHDPRGRFARNQLAVFLEYRGRFPEAIKHFEQLIDHYPDFFGGYYGIGRINMKMKNYPVALNWLNKAVERNQKRADMHQDRGQVFLMTGHPEKAIEDFSQAIEYVKLSRAFFLRALAYRNTGKYDPAMDDLRFYLSKQPHDLSARLTMLEILFESGNWSSGTTGVLQLLSEASVSISLREAVFVALTTPDLLSVLKRMFPFRSYFRHNSGWFFF